MVWCLLGLLGICSVVLLHVLRTEIDELLAKVDIFSVRVDVEPLELLHIPLSLLLFSLLAPLFLPGFVLVILSLTLFCQLFAGFVALATLHLVLRLAFVLLDDHQLGLCDPLDVLDVSLLDLVVAHLAVEIFLDLPLFIDHSSLFLHNFVDLDFEVGQVVLLQLLLLIKLCVRALDLADALFERVDDLVGRRHRLSYLVLLRPEVRNLNLKCRYLDEKWLRLLNLFYLFNEFCFVNPVPVRGLEALFKLLDTLLELGLVVVDRVYIFTHFHKLSIETLDLAFNFLNASETLLFLLIVLI